MFMQDIAYRGISQDKILRPPLFPIWKFKTAGPVNSSPVAVGDTVYIGSDDNHLYALDMNNWGLKWDFESGGKITSAPTVYRGIVYFSSRDLNIYALDAKTGKKKWQTDVDGWVNSPVVAHGDKLYVGCYENKIYILHTETGKKLGLERARIKIGLSDYACIRGEFYPVDAYTRSAIWKGLVGGSESWPATANGFVYIGSRDNKIHAFNASDRKHVWQYKTDGWIDSSPAISKGKLYIGSRDGYVYAFDNKGKTESVYTSEGIITKNRVNIYEKPNGLPLLKVAQLNEDMTLPILETRSGNWYLNPSESWFRVKLPNDQTGWVSAENFIKTKWTNDLQINSGLVRDVVKLKLPKDAETTSWSPDGSKMAYFANTSDRNIYWMAQSIWVASANGNNPQWVSDGAFFNPNITWSKDGEWIVFENLSGEERQIWIASSDATGLKKITIGEAPSISPKGDKIAFVRRGKSSTSIWIRDLNNNNERKIAEVTIKGQQSYIAYGYNANFNPPSWSSDGSLIAFGFDGYHYDDKYTRVALIRISGGIIREFAVRAWRMKNTELSNDGKKIAYITHEHSTKEANDVLDKQVHFTSIDDNSSVRSYRHSEGISWSPDGRYLAFVEKSITMGINRRVWILDTQKNQQIQLLTSRQEIEKVAWIKNDKIVILARTSKQDLSESAGAIGKIQSWLVTIKNLPA
jgi:outer membrane protein assembly factor BamB/Tol biopolymer transport system component